MTNIADEDLRPRTGAAVHDEVRDVAAAIGRWLRSGGTQAADGAFCGWRDLRTGALSAPYPEITGYALNYLADGPLDGADRAVAVADAACGWLLARLGAGDRSARPERTGAAVYTFDLGMQAHGLMRYGRETGDQATVAAGLRTAEYLVALVDEHGALPAVVPGTARSPLPSTWSTTGRVHLLKTVQALLSAGDLGLGGATAAAGRLVRQELDGAAGMPPVTCPGADLIGLHALCYAAEGLWAWGIHQGDAAALRRSREITAWVWRRRLPGGGLPGFVRAGDHAEPTARQSDVVAQAIRLATLHRLTDVDVAAEAALVARGAWRDGPHAAVFYRPGSGDEHLNCWASMFAGQALDLACGARTSLEWYELV